MPTDGTATRDAIMDAVIARAADGLDAITIEAVIAAAGTTNGSIYHHFGSRAGMLSAAVDRVFAEAMAAASMALDDRPAVEAIGDFTVRYLDWVAGNRPEATLLYGVPLLLADGVISEAKVAAFTPVAHWLLVRMATGVVVEMDVLLLDPVGFGPVHEVCRRWLANPDHIDLALIAPAVAGAVVRILTPPA